MLIPAPYFTTHTLAYRGYFNATAYFTFWSFQKSIASDCSLDFLKLLQWGESHSVRETLQQSDWRGWGEIFDRDVSFVRIVAVLWRPQEHFRVRFVLTAFFGTLTWLIPSSFHWSSETPVRRFFQELFPWNFMDSVRESSLDFMVFMKFILGGVGHYFIFCLFLLWLARRMHSLPCPISSFGFMLL